MKRLPLTALLAAAFVLLLWFVAVRQAALWAVGIAMGVALARARFGFTTGWRQLIEARDPKGVIGQLLLLGLAAQVELQPTDLFPAGRAALVVCNPPWLPARPGSPLERAVYDEDSRMLRGFLDGLAAHLAPGGEGWLILSDLAEHLGLRRRDELLHWIDLWREPPLLAAGSGQAPTGGHCSAPK